MSHKFEGRLADAVERMWDLPPMMLTMPSAEAGAAAPPRSVGAYFQLLLEARDLYVLGHFYSCVAMCGIVGERLIKDVLRASVLIERDGNVEHPSDAAFDQMEYVDARGIVQFLRRAQLLDDDAAKAAIGLGELRNRYAHARGKKPAEDALEAIKLLDAIVSGTVSALKDHEIREGRFVRKERAAIRETSISVRPDKPMKG
jgi:hypothetical protein